jgi:hypothetical protein
MKTNLLIRKANSLCNVAIWGICLLFFYCIPVYVFSQPDSWRRMKDVPNSDPFSRFGAVAFSIGKSAYVGTGINEYGGNKFSNFWKYETESGSWVQIADFAGGKRYEAVGFSINGKGYVGTGIPESADPYERKGSKDFWEYNPQTNRWLRKADFAGTARYAAVGFSIGNKGYIGTGTDKNGDTKDFWEYNPSNNTWRKRANVGGLARNSGIGLNTSTKGYIGLGYTNTYATDFWEYNPETNLWNKKADFSPVATNAQGIDASGFAIGDSLYIVAGHKAKAEVWNFNTILNKWSLLANNLQPQSLSGAVGFNIDNKGYIVGGSNTSGSELRNEFWEFDSFDNYWEQLNFWTGIGRYDMVGFGLNTLGYIGLGSKASGYSDLQEFWEFNPDKNTWNEKKSFSRKARHSAIAFNIGAKGYMGLGNGAYKDIWEYDQLNNHWRQIANFPGKIGDESVAFSINGNGYVGTGWAEVGHEKEFWQYNASTNRWKRKANFVGMGRTNAVGFAIGNKGYIGTGLGYGPYGKILGDFWEYNTLNDSWTQKADFGGLPRFASVGFALGNRGYIYSGINFNGDLDDYLWEYNPSIDKWVRRANGPGFRLDAVSFVVGNKAYVGTGSALWWTWYNDLWEYTPPLENYILTNITGNTFCSNNTLRIKYTSSGSYQSGNLFTAQLSDSSGNFTNPTTIGSTASTTSGSINATIPAGILPGTHYRIRVVSSKPAINGFDNGNDISINPMPMVKTRNTTVYLKDNGRTSITTRQIDNGSRATCGTLRYNLSKTTFNCSNIGVNTVMLTVTDGNGNKDSATAFVTVKDNDRPAINTISVSPDRLWPANHNMKLVTVNYRTWDNCGVTKTWLTASSSDAPMLTNNPDINILDNHRMMLRAERSRPTRNRIYTITIYAQDASGNIETRRVMVEVSPTNTLTLNINSGLAEQAIANELITGLQIKLIPNPTTNFSTLVFQGNNPVPITLVVTDMMGRVVESRSNIQSGSTISLGSKYAKGIYLIKVIQGIENQTVKMIKN